MITTFENLYCSKADKTRYERLHNEFKAFYGKKNNTSFFSSPGRTEIGGNHTDHNRGKVLAAAINLDIISEAAVNNSDIIRLKSLEYNKIDIIDISEKNKKDSEIGRSASLIRGICSKCIDMGYKVGGFDAYTVSKVLKGSGLSSSAAFEVLVVTIINHLFNDDKIPPIECAKIAQFAENNYYGKPSGLMDQTACALGGFMKIDFADPYEPTVESIDMDLSEEGYSLCIIDIGDTHSNKSSEYASIPDEMKSVALYLSCGYLSQADEDEFYAKLPSIRSNCGDRAVLRAIHFFNENKRVDAQAQALQNRDMKSFLQLVRESGESSLSCLQNIYSEGNPKSQGLGIALTLSKQILGNNGAYRVHGGGFGGTMQAFVPEDFVNSYKSKIEAVFGVGSCHTLSVRPIGSCKVEF